jgi:hypothetical protein
MQQRVAAFCLLAFATVPLHPAAAATLPDIKASPSNGVPECVTPGRLLAYLKARNPGLDPRFESVPSHYMRQGELLGVRWDFAFYQMILETGSLSFRNGSRSGDVKPAQNNFAGLGATGRGEHGESFKDIATGVRAHLEHLLLYSGEKLDRPTAERTRKVQEWGVLTKWQSRFDRPINFSDLAQQWSPGNTAYARMLDGIAQRFGEYCEQPDPRPELLAEVHRDLRLAAARAQAPSGTELARRAIEAGKAERDANRSALGLAAQAPETQPLTGALPASKGPSVGFKILNAPKETAPDASDAPAAVAPAASVAAEPPARERDAQTRPAGSAASASKAAPAAENQQPQFQIASAAGAAKQAAPPPAAAGQKCRVWTASYGGQKALIIRSVIDKVVNYTVLDVNEGAEKREAEAFIAAYAKDGIIAGEFVSQTQALDRAFELCPEG